MTDVYRAYCICNDWHNTREHVRMNFSLNSTFHPDQTGKDETISRIIMESVPGRQITLAHIIASPDQILYRKLGLDPNVDYKNAAIGILTQTPYETAIITADIALKAAAIQLGFVDRFSGTLVVTGSISDVTIAWEKVLDYVHTTLGFDVCQITKA